MCGAQLLLGTLHERLETFLGRSVTGWTLCNTDKTVCEEGRAAEVSCLSGQSFLNQHSAKKLIAKLQYREIRTSLDAQTSRSCREPVSELLYRNSIRWTKAKKLEKSACLKHVLQFRY